MPESIDYSEKYPLWTLTVKRGLGSFLVGKCGCGWESDAHLRTVVIAEEWDEHMLTSTPEQHQKYSGMHHQAPKVETCDCQLCAERRGDNETDLEIEAVEREIKREKLDELNHENVD